MRCIALILICVLLTACGADSNVENQAYAVILAADMTDGGGIELTIRVPKITKSGDDNYLTISARGTDMQDALDNLEIAAPRYVNLSQLTLLIVSRKLAESGKMRGAMEMMKRNYRVYNAASFAVCEGRAGDFAAAQEAVIGERLSTGIEAMLESYEKLGYIPDATIADVYYLSHSAYSDPLAAACEIKDGKNIYMGAYLMKDGSTVGRLTGMQMVFVNLVKGMVDGFSYSDGGAPVQLVSLKKPDIDIELNGDSPVISISFKLSALGLERDADTENLIENLSADILETISACQLAGCEPFGFADTASRGFLTMKAWRAYDWREKFRNANINIDVDISMIDG